MEYVNLPIITDVREEFFYIEDDPDDTFVQNISDAMIINLLWEEKSGRADPKNLD